MNSSNWPAATEESILIAENALKVEFPGLLRQMWLTCNGLELANGHWRVFPVFDPEKARKTSRDIVYENTYGRKFLPENLIAIAASTSGTGNRLVLKRNGKLLGSEVFVYIYLTRNTLRWKDSLDALCIQARLNAAAN